MLRGGSPDAATSDAFRELGEPVPEMLSLTLEKVLRRPSMSAERLSACIPVMAFPEEALEAKPSAYAGYCGQDYWSSCPGTA